MQAIIGGMGSAVVFAAGLLLAARGSRVIGAPASLAAVLGVGFLLDVPLTVASLPVRLSAVDAAWLAVSGAGNVGALLLAYAAFRSGPLGTGAAILSTEGAVTAVIASLTGARPSLPVAGALAVVVAGVVLAARATPAAGSVTTSERRRQVVLPLGGALSAGTGLYATGHVSALALPIVVLPPRLVGTAVLTLPLLATRRLRVPRSVLPFVLGPAVAELAGFFLYAWGSRDGVATAAVLQSTFGAVAAVLGYLVLRERLRRLQVIGILAITAGVAVLSALTAA